MVTLYDIFFWFGVVAAAEIGVFACLFLIPHRRRRTCASFGCDRVPMPGWRICLKCRNCKTEPMLSTQLESFRDAS